MEFDQSQSLNPELLGLSLEKIEEFIQILEEKEKELEANSEFSQAAKVREKINKLAELKLSKTAKNIQINNQQQILNLHEEREAELSGYTTESDQQRKEIEDKGNQMLTELLEKHEQEKEVFRQEFEQTFPRQNIASTKEILELTRKLNVVIKKKDYDTAHKYNEEIQRLTELNDKKWNENVKSQKFEFQIQKITKRQTLEVNSLKSKIESILNEFNKKRNIDIEKIEKKYNNRERELVNDLSCKGNAIILNSIKTIGKNDSNFNKTYSKKKTFNTANSSKSSMTI